MLTLAPSCVASIAQVAGKLLNFWCAHTDPGGRPSQGPIPPPNAGATGIKVWLDIAVGYGRQVATFSRCKTSKRGIGCVKARPVSPGLGGAPVKLLLAFVLFRLLDVWKPWPLRQLERWEGGWGIVADDLGAALGAGGIVHLVSALLHR